MLNYFWKKISCIAGFVLVTFLTLSITAQAVEKNAENAKPPMRVAVISFQPLIPKEKQGTRSFVRFAA